MAKGQTIAELQQALKAKRGQMASLKARQAKAAAKLRKATKALKNATAVQVQATASEAKARAALKALDDAIAALAGAPAAATPAKKAPKAKAAPKKAAPKKVAPKKAPAAKKAPKAKKAAPAGGLAGILVKVLSGKAGVSVPEATKLVLATGYTSKSKQFQTIVNQTLLRDPRFVKGARGVYALTGQAKAAPKKAAPKPKKAAAPKKAARKAHKKAAKKKAPKKAAPKAKAKKAAATGSLKSVLIDILKGKKAVGIAEATAAVLAKGYKSKAKNFKLNVNQMLAKNPAFKQVGRGKYAVK